jgi:hypothetical protein
VTDEHDLTARASSGTPGVIGSVVDVAFAGEGRQRWLELTAQAACAAPDDPAPCRPTPLVRA